MGGGAVLAWRGARRLGRYGLDPGRAVAPRGPATVGIAGPVPVLSETITIEGPRAGLCGAIW
jgi:hypothetical protein